MHAHCASPPQDIVRLTFKAFHDVLRAQGDAIKVRPGMRAQDVCRKGWYGRGMGGNSPARCHLCRTDLTMHASTLSRGSAPFWQGWTAAAPLPPPSSLALPPLPVRGSRYVTYPVHQAIERAVDTKASRAEVTTGLQQKANVADMAARIREVSRRGGSAGPRCGVRYDGGGPAQGRVGGGTGRESRQPKARARG